MRWIASIALAAVAALAGCGGGDGSQTLTEPAPTARPVIHLSSPAFAPAAMLPARFTCSGAGVSPPLRWKDIPVGTSSLALLLEDRDSPGGTFVHWTAWDISPKSGALAAAAKPPHQGANSSGDTGYAPPCPPNGDRPHRYDFTLYALSEPLDLSDGAQPGAVLSAVAESAIAEGTLTARFGR